ncbi:uncharacterized protein BKCO1_2000109 [Diplodia corticola]|uniref:Uncharacterized protein n=1 Tax=Diplodia corticola TaxID=236234 RepID=A0A1J9RIT4_9PEZI|nr:uncharacterized protein BKCO1_2000109 [Diplodia corticola]OJD39938.1 hypothetical protein BKCO1_2000109 [Diplodia corticola]
MAPISRRKSSSETRVNAHEMEIANAGRLNPAHCQGNSPVEAQAVNPYNPSNNSNGQAQSKGVDRRSFAPLRPSPLSTCDQALRIAPGPLVEAWRCEGQGQTRGMQSQASQEGRHHSPLGFISASTRPHTPPPLVPPFAFEIRRSNTTPEKQNGPMICSSTRHYTPRYWPAGVVYGGQTPISNPTPYDLAYQRALEVIYPSTSHYTPSYWPAGVAYGGQTPIFDPTLGPPYNLAYQHAQSRQGPIQAMPVGQPLVEERPTLSPSNVPYAPRPVPVQHPSSPAKHFPPTSLNELSPLSSSGTDMSHTSAQSNTHYPARDFPKNGPSSSQASPGGSQSTAAHLYYRPSLPPPKPQGGYVPLPKPTPAICSGWKNNDLEPFLASVARTQTENSHRGHHSNNPAIAPPSSIPDRSTAPSGGNPNKVAEAKP